MTIFGLNSPEIFLLLLISLVILGTKRIEKGLNLFSKLLKFLLNSQKNIDKIAEEIEPTKAIEETQKKEEEITRSKESTKAKKIEPTKAIEETQKKEEEIKSSKESTKAKKIELTQVMDETQKKEEEIKRSKESTKAKKMEPTKAIEETQKKEEEITRSKESTKAKKIEQKKEINKTNKKENKSEMKLQIANAENKGKKSIKIKDSSGILKDENTIKAKTKNSKRISKGKTVREPKIIDLEKGQLDKKI